MFKKVFFTVTMFLLLFSLMSPVSTKAGLESSEELVSTKTAQATKLKELKDRRTSNSKLFELTDGTYQMEITGKDVHYEDNHGNYQEINTRLTDEADWDKLSMPISKEADNQIKNSLNITDNVIGMQSMEKIDRNKTNYRAMHVPFDVTLPKDFNKGYSIGKGSEKLIFTPINSSSVIGSVYGNKIIYHDAWPDTDVFLEVISDGLKETIVLQSEQAPVAFSFVVNGIPENLSDLHKLYLHPAWLIDAAGVTRDVEQIIRKEGNNTYIDIIADTTDLQYPISIDPTVTIQNNTKDTSYYYKDSLNYDYGHPTSPNLLIGRGVSTYYESYLQFDLTSAPQAEAIISAKLNMYVTYAGDTQTRVLNIYRVTSPWDESSLYYFNQPTRTTTFLSGVTGHYGWNGGQVIQGWSEIDITPYVVAWKSGEPNYGIKVSGSDLVDSMKQFASKESPNQAIIPKIVITYNSPPNIPNIIFPAQNDVVDTTSLITWIAATDPETPQAGLKYELQLSTNNGTSWSSLLNLSSAGVTSYSYNFSSAPNTTQARIRIRAYDGGLYSAWSVSSPFSIKHNQPPTAPSNPIPSGISSVNAVMVNSTTPSLSWTFSDPDAGDSQSSYRVLVYQTNNTVLWDSGWINSTISSYTVPSGKLTRGTTYYWRVQTKDLKGLSSPLSGNAFIKVNRLPIASFTSYTDNQTLPDNRLTFTWTYTDADSHAQNRYQLQGSKDNWATITYNSGEVNSSSTSLTENFTQGEWDFRVRVFDGLEWSNWSYRNNLTLPNSFEPNDSFATAFSAQYGQEYTTLISSASDVDFFKWTAGKTGIDRIHLSVPAGKNYDLVIYDASNALLSTGNRAASSSEEQFIYVTQGQTYYAKIVAPSGDFGVVPYTLTIQPFGVVNVPYQTIYDYDDNGNLTTKTTTTP